MLTVLAESKNKDSGKLNLKDPVYNYIIEQLPEKERKELEGSISKPEDLVENPKDIKKQWEAEIPPTVEFPVRTLGSLLGLVGGGAGVGALVAPNLPKDDAGYALSLLSVFGGGALGGLLGRDLAAYALKFIYRNPKKKVQIGVDKEGKPVYVEIYTGQSVFERMRQFYD